MRYPVRWQDFGFFGQPTGRLPPSIDIFYGKNIDKKLKILDSTYVNDPY